MRILGLDTATAVASAALFDDGQIRAEQISSNLQPSNQSSAASARVNHTETVLPLVESVLKKSRLSFYEVSGIAFSIGPGSFTGLRIGLSTVKGLAYGWDLPVVGVSTLMANAARVSAFQGSICSLFDARKNELYAALFQRNAKGLTRLTEDFVAPAEAVIDRLRTLASPPPYLFIGDGTEACKTLLLDAFGENIQLSGGDSFHSIAASVARLSVDRFNRSEVEELGHCVPLYLSLSQGQSRAKKEVVTD